MTNFDLSPSMRGSSLRHFRYLFEDTQQFCTHPLTRGNTHLVIRAVTVELLLC